MSAPEIYFIQLYRQEPGDTAAKDIPVASDQDYEAAARNALLSYFKDEKIAPHQRPHHARVVTHDRGKTIMKLMATSARSVEKI